jgi:hypothetical protein
MIKSKLIDASNWHETQNHILSEIAACGIIGFDIETQDHDRHEGQWHRAQRAPRRPASDQRIVYAQ